MENYGGTLIANNVVWAGNTAQLCLPKQRALAAGILIAHSSPLGLAQIGGGAIDNNYGNADIKDCKFEGNTATDPAYGLCLPKQRALAAGILIAHFTPCD